MKKILSVFLTLAMVLNGANCKIFANEAQKDDKKQTAKNKSFSWWKRAGTAALAGVAAYKFNELKNERDLLNPEPTTPPTSSDEEDDDLSSGDDYYGAPLPFISPQNSGEMGRMIVVPARRSCQQGEKHVRLVLPYSERLLTIGGHEIIDADDLEKYKLKHKNKEKAAHDEEAKSETLCVPEEEEIVEYVEYAEEEESFIEPAGDTPDLSLRDYLSAFASERQNAADFLREISRLLGVITFPLVVVNGIAAVDVGAGFSLRLRFVNSNRPTNLLTIPGQLTPFELIVNGEKMLVKNKEKNTWHSISDTLELIAQRNY